MKRVFAIALALVMMLSVVLGCTSNKKETPPANQTKITENQNKANSNAVKAADNDKQVKQQKQNGSEKNVANADTETKAKVDVVKGKAYTDKDHVAAYIHVYKTLPPNYITKGQATKLGWKTKGTLDQVAPGKSIGGDRYGNYVLQRRADLLYFVPLPEV